MKHTLVVPLLTGLAAADTLIAGLGSSYAYGPGLTVKIGDYLSSALSQKYNQKWNFTNLAVSGSHLDNIYNNQSNYLKGLSPDIVYMVSGGNDLNYVTCLLSPSSGVCANPEPESVWQSNFTMALHSIFNAVANPDSVIVYVLTYPIAIYNDSGCPGGTGCPSANAAQLSQIDVLYNKQVDFTVDGLNAWNANSANKNLTTQLIPMRQYSKGPPEHDINSPSPWIWDGRSSNPAPWHPNPAGASNMSNYIYNDYIHRAH